MGAETLQRLEGDEVHPREASIAFASRALQQVSLPVGGCIAASLEQ